MTYKPWHAACDQISGIIHDTGWDSVSLHCINKLHISYRIQRELLAIYSFEYFHLFWNNHFFRQ